MKKSIRLLGAASLLVASVAAHAVDDTYVFESLSSVEHVFGVPYTITLTGVLANGSVPTSVSVPASNSVSVDRCMKQYDVMLKEDGEFTLSVIVRTETSTGPGGFPQTTISLLKCSLTRNP